MDIRFVRLDIRSFMRESYAYCRLHEGEIRMHMEAAERQQEQTGAEKQG